jgi:hypothetical protein
MCSASPSVLPGLHQAQPGLQAFCSMRYSKTRDWTKYSCFSTFPARKGDQIQWWADHWWVFYHYSNHSWLKILTRLWRTDYCGQPKRNAGQQGHLLSVSLQWPHCGSYCLVVAGSHNMEESLTNSPGFGENSKGLSHIWQMKIKANVPFQYELAEHAVFLQSMKNPQASQSASQPASTRNINFSRHLCRK